MSININGKLRIKGSTTAGPGGGGGGYGALTTAWISATGESDATILGALNTLETNLNTYGLTSKMTGLYPFVGGTATKHSFNFVNTSQYQLTFLGGWTHSSNGALPNGTNGYANTGIYPLNADNFGFGFYGYKSTYEPKAQMGAEYGASLCYLYACYSAAGPMYARINGGSQFTTYGPYSNVKGFYSISKTDASTVLTRAATVTSSFASSAGISQNNLPMFIGAASYGAAGDDYCNTEFRGAFVGQGLTDTESGNLKSSFETFNATLSRQA